MILQHSIDLASALLATCVAVFCLLSWGQLTIRVLGINPDTIQIHHAWIGLTSILGIANLAQIFLPITWHISLAFLLIATLNAYYYRNSWQDLLALLKRSVLHHPLLSFVTCLAICCLSSGALLAPGNYDSGLYHFTTIAWLNQHPITLGLGNLHGRLAFNQSYFSAVALLNVYPLWNKGYSVAGPLLIYLGFASIAFGGLEKIRLGLYLQIAFFFLIASLCTDISAPTPDLAISVLQIVIFAQLIWLSYQKYEGVLLKPTQMIAFAFLCFLICTMKLSGIVFGMSALCLMAWIHTASICHQSSPLKRALGLLIIFACIHLLRSTLLSGAPLYPAPILSMSWLDWAIPINTIQNELNWTYSWARRPGYDIKAVLGNWNWFIPWLKALPISAWLCGIITSISLPWYFYSKHKRSSNSQAPLTYTDNAFIYGTLFPLLPLLPLFMGILFWFLTAPDLRFLGVLHQLLAIYSVWLVWSQKSIGTPNHRPNNLHDNGMLSTQLTAYGLIGAVFVASTLQVLRPKIFSGYEPLPLIETKPLQTQSGTVIYTPVSGEQCGNANLPCTPYFNPKIKEGRLYEWWIIYSVQ